VKAGTTPAGHGAAPPGISFDRFVRACVVVKQLSEVRCVFFFHTFLCEERRDVPTHPTRMELDGRWWSWTAVGMGCRGVSWRGVSWRVVAHLVDVDDTGGVETCCHAREVAC
jgi:hypothetical protein